WHVDHLTDPQAVVPESIMPKYAFLADRMIDGKYIEDVMRTNAAVGVPYTDDAFENAVADFKAQADPDSDYDGLQARYGSESAFKSPDVNVRNFDGKAGISEMDALIAYLQMLGTLVDFSTFIPAASR
ncbi:MAG TPA: cytochrome-c oxidase, cbb3-type subunit II, partial [Rhodobacterales bacterium]|nr:cytochrome-c oxidase, cbb3-type subunit II [Rhodobacterales bacterium]